MVKDKEVKEKKMAFAYSTQDSGEKEKLLAAGLHVIGQVEDSDGIMKYTFKENIPQVNKVKKELGITVPEKKEKEDKKEDKKEW